MYRNDVVKKYIVYMPVLLLLIGILLPSQPVYGESGFSIAPAKLEVTIKGNEVIPIYVYITSDYDGELIVGVENLPFRIEPSTIPVKSMDDHRRVELRIFGDSSLDEGSYSGKLTFLAYSGKNIAYGIKVQTTVKLVNEQQEAEQNAETDQSNDINYLVIIGIIAACLVLLIIFLVIYKKYR
jgi:hypothetical protein